MFLQIIGLVMTVLPFRDHVVFYTVAFLAFSRNDAFSILSSPPKHPVDNTLGSLFGDRQQQGSLRAVLSEPENSQFGRQDFWDQLYEQQSNFSWYAGWEELQPFVDELLVDKNDRVLIPGVGNDAALVDMYDHGYSYLTAMDYAPEGIERCREMLGPSRLRNLSDSEGVAGVHLVVADARNLTGVFEDNQFDAVVEKGTLDAIFLSGGQDKERSLENLRMAVSELGRCVKPGGTWISIAAVVVDQIQDLFDSDSEWTCQVDKETLYMTEDGYTSNNIDGNLLVWKKEG